MEKREKKSTVESPIKGSPYVETRVFLFSAGVVTFEDPPKEVNEELRLQDKIQNSIFE